MIQNKETDLRKPLKCQGQDHEVAGAENRAWNVEICRGPNCQNMVIILMWFGNEGWS